MLPPQSPRGFSALARLYYLARPTKTAMLRRLNPSRVSADEVEIREKRSLLSRGRKAVKKNATFNLSDIEKRLRDVEDRYVLFSLLKSPYSFQLRKLL